MAKRKPRVRWHEEAQLELVKNKLRVAARQRMTMAEDPEYWDKNLRKVSLFVVRECDLRATLEEKSLSVSPFTDWTAFVNRAGTLVHVVPRDGDLHIRLPLYFSIKNNGDSYIKQVIQSAIGGRLS